MKCLNKGGNWSANIKFKKSTTKSKKKIKINKSLHCFIAQSYTFLPLSIDCPQTENIQ